MPASFDPRERWEYPACTRILTGEMRARGYVPPVTFSRDEVRRHAPYVRNVRPRF